MTFFPENHAVCEVMRKKFSGARDARDINTIRRMRLACWINKAADTHSEYVILIAFPRQRWFLKRASVSHYTYIASLASL
jgi:hypothetical protein